MSVKPRGRPNNATTLAKAAGGTETLTKLMLRSSTRDKMAGPAGQRKSPTSTKEQIDENSKDHSTPRNTELGANGVSAILSKLEEMTKDIRRFREVAEEFKVFKQEINKLNCRNALLEAENQLLNERLTKLEQREDSREKEGKKLNIVIKGLEDEIESDRDIERFIEENLEVKGKVEQVAKFGKSQQNKGVVVRLSSLSHKQSIMENKIKLRGTNVYINHDRTLREREIQRKIYQIAREREAEGSKVKMGFKSLKIDDRQMVWVEGKGLVESFRGQNQAKRTSGQYSQPGSPNYRRGSPGARAH